MASENSPFAFMQVSDVHLDSKLSSRRLGFSEAQRRERQAEILDVFLRSLDEASRRGVDAVLVPGDLWDSEAVTGRTVNRILEACAALGDIPLLIAPGNHDYCGAGSLYDPAVLEARGMRRWPDNVHIFRSPDFQTFRHPRRTDVSFTGRAFSGNVVVSERLLSRPVPLDDKAAVNILLFHGSLDGYAGGDSGWPGKITAPFSTAELERLGFSYAAVGHYHDYTEIRADDGRLLGAYSGCPAGRWFDEDGPRYVVFGSLDPARQGDGCLLEKLELDRRRLVVVSCDITGSTSAEVSSDLEEELARCGAREKDDIVRIRLEGRHATGGEPVYVAERLRGRYYQLVIDDETRPDYLTEKYDKRTTEGKFIQAMLDMKKEAESAGGTLSGTNDGAQFTVEEIEDALYYGLDALKQKKVVVRHVD